MLPVTIAFPQLLLNDHVMPGARFANRPWNNAVNWIVISALLGLPLVLLVRELGQSRPSFLSRDPRRVRSGEFDHERLSLPKPGSTLPRRAIHSLDAPTKWK
jgi:hypothetical protein